MTNLHAQWLKGTTASPPSLQTSTLQGTSLNRQSFWQRKRPRCLISLVTPFWRISGSSRSKIWSQSSPTSNKCKGSWGRRPNGGSQIRSSSISSLRSRRWRETAAASGEGRQVLTGIGSISIYKERIWKLTGSRKRRNRRSLRRQPFSPSSARRAWRS